MNATSAKSKGDKAAAATPSGIERIAPSGNLTIYEAASLKDRFLNIPAQCTAIEFDLSEVVEIDTAGMQLLLLAQRESQHQGKSFGISACSPAVQDLIELYDLADLFGMVKARSEPEALAT